mmetsp:Transcript_25191/g.71189  ORF Transcript_25191/g.71189 Transcript_25191/m.71189 type:complete len:282 (+) Transcript_25191:582-1427(+)
MHTCTTHPCRRQTRATTATRAWSQQLQRAAPAGPQPADERGATLAERAACARRVERRDATRAGRRRRLRRADRDLRHVHQGQAPHVAHGSGTSLAAEQNQALARRVVHHRGARPRRRPRFFQGERDPLLLHKGIQAGVERVSKPDKARKRDHDTAPEVGHCHLLQYRPARVTIEVEAPQIIQRATCAYATKHQQLPLHDCDRVVVPRWRSHGVGIAGIQPHPCCLRLARNGGERDRPLAHRPMRRVVPLLINHADLPVPGRFVEREPAVTAQGAFRSKGPG